MNVNCLKKDIKRIIKRYTHITLRGKTGRQTLGKKRMEEEYLSKIVIALNTHDVKR